MTAPWGKGRFVRSALVVVVIGSCTFGDGTASPSIDTNPTPGPAFSEPQRLVSEGGSLEVDLKVTQGGVEIDGESVRGRIYNGTFGGPSIVVRPGDRLEVTLANQLPEPTNLHFHGFHVSPQGKSDNVFRTVDTAQTDEYVLDIPSDHEPGLYWYHAHLHGISEGQVFGGLSGMLIVEGLTELLPADLQGIEQRYFALRDVQVEDGQVPQVNIDSGAPTTRLVNGLVNPRLQIAPGETQLWHFANIGADIWYDLQLEGHTFQVVAEDASPVWAVWEADHLILPPGKRYEVLVQGGPADTYRLETLAYDQGKAGDQYPEATLATLTSEGDAVTPAAMPDGLVPFEDLGDLPIAGERRFVFQEDDATNKFSINGVAFDPARTDADPIVGTVERWVLVNDTEEQHPFHIHVNDFQVESINGEPYDARGRQDTVALPVGGTVVILNPFEDFTGKFVFHCHILAHEDLGMMAVVDVLNEDGESEAGPAHEHST
ncbi:MAG: multicopper oxidase family protein [Actinomycetota bacterium]